MMAERKTRVAILFGGRSAEHDVSRASAANVLRSRLSQISCALAAGTELRPPQWTRTSPNDSCAMWDCRLRHSSQCRSHLRSSRRYRRSSARSWKTRMPAFAHRNSERSFQPKSTVSIRTMRNTSMATAPRFIFRPICRLLGGSHQGARDQDVPRALLRRNGAHRLLCQRRASVRERSKHPARIHQCQHVSEDVGSQRVASSRTHERLDRPRIGASQRLQDLDVSARVERPLRVRNERRVRLS